MNMTLDLMPVIPEIALLSFACVVLLVDVYGGKKSGVYCYTLSQLSLFITAFLVVWVYTSAGHTQNAFLDSFKLDALAMILKFAICFVTATVFLYSRKYLLQIGIFRGEYFTLGLFGVLGMLVMVSAYSLLVIYLGLELLSLSLYAMVAYHRNSSQASEAAMKFFVLGAIASAMLLYGMSLIYGSAGSINITDIKQAIVNGQVNQTVMALGVVFTVVGIGFKFGAVPFHMWVPDVYHGSPTAVTVYISTAPKLAAFAMLIRLLAEGLGDMFTHWQDMLILLAVLSIALGNVVAIAQTNIKRMLAYSTISHVGFMFLGVLTGNAEGYAAAMYYILVYSIMSLGAFGMIILLSRRGFEADRIEDFKGLNERSSWFAAMMGILMLSMAGIPPMLGFYAKLTVLQAVISKGMVWLAVVAVVFSVIGAFYYLRIIRVMYFEKIEHSIPLESTADMRFAVSTNGLAILVLGIFPGGLLAICVAALKEIAL